VHSVDIAVGTISMYVYSKGGPHTALAPRPSLIYCAWNHIYLILFTAIYSSLESEFVVRIETFNVQNILYIVVSEACETDCVLIGL
jgi:hypothetical protein